VAALELGRKFVLVDDNPEAIAVMRERFSGQQVVFIDDVEGVRK
jgi:site-specific DNA-methyltransferase (adenine-specific)